MTNQLKKRDSPAIILSPKPNSYDGKEYPSTRAALRAKRESMGCGRGDKKNQYAAGTSHLDHEPSIRNNKKERRKKKGQ